ncbi:CTP synthetase [Alphaproteobacteria bacterium]
MDTKFIFITGGVVSSLGKGIAAASLAVLLQARGYSIRIRKLDPYLNVDPGTMNPYQHGEVFVTDDGAETDLDLGHYERFTNINAKRGDNVTSGQIYSKLLLQERRGEYLGVTVQVIPHVTNLIKEFIVDDVDGVNFLICEIGGTVGDIEGLPYFEAIRQLGYEMGPNRVIYIHLTLLPFIASARELKTKPTQHSVKELRSIGIQPDILLCRTDRPIPFVEKSKIGLFCNVPEYSVIDALDQDSIYKIPVAYSGTGLDSVVLKLFKLDNITTPDLREWKNIVHKIDNPQTSVDIAIVAKYHQLTDAYKSLVEAFIHAGIYHQCKVNLSWVDAEILDDEKEVFACLQHVDGVMVPGGFGHRGIGGKINAIKYAREHKIPFFGICLGMQLSIVEFARNVLGMSDANSSEFSDSGTHVINLMTEWDKGGEKQVRAYNDAKGGTMRLGQYECRIMSSSLAHDIYGTTNIKERHRHRFEFNIEYRGVFESAGVRFSGLSPDGMLVEIMELTGHPWFVAVQFHPEFKSGPFVPHPLFISFIRQAMVCRGVA